MALKGSKRPVIGFQVTNMMDEYPKLLIRGVLDRARELDIDVVLYWTMSIHWPIGYAYQYNVVSEMIDKDYVDALIISTGALANYLNKDEMKAYIRKYYRIPIVSIAIPLESSPSVQVNNESGIKAAVEHLYRIHSRTNIAFIRGPATNPEAEIRFKAYREGLETCGLTYDSRLVADGIFWDSSGTEAVRLFLDERKVSIDAIIGANDEMAIAAIRELQRRKISVPEQVAVIGFDNTLNCENVIPQLTTVKQPIYLQGKRSLELAYDLVNGKNVPELTILPTSLVIRNSCGCSGYSNEALGSEAPINGDDFERINGPNLLEKIKAEMLSSMVEQSDNSAPHLEITKETITDILNFLSLKVTPEPGLPVLLSKITATMISLIKDGQDISYWQDMINRLMTYESSLKKSGFTDTNLMIHNILNLVQSIISHYHLLELTTIDKFNHLTRNVVNDIISSTTLPQILTQVKSHMLEMGMDCYIFIYEKAVINHYDDLWDQPQKARMILAVCADCHIEFMSPAGIEIPVKGFIPEGFYGNESKKAYLVIPLYVMEVQYGYMIYSLTSRNGLFYDMMTLGISSSYRSAQLLSDLTREQGLLEKRNQEIENEIMMARKIQLQLIPARSEKPNIAFLYKPMKKVGGDFLDFLDFRESDWTGIFISDVSGHGVPAALITSMLKSTLQQLRSRLSNPAETLSMLNESLISLAGGNFVTAIYGIYKAKSHEFFHSSAGHCHPIILHQDKMVELNNARSGPPLAVLGQKGMAKLGKPYENTRVKLEPGSKLILYTDGISETTASGNSDIDFETAGFKNSMLSSFHLPAPDFVQAVYRELNNFHHDPKEEFEDDLCLICVDVV